MASIIYDSFLPDVFSGALNMTGPYKGLLVTDAYVENRATHTRRNHITNEASGTGYTAGGASVTLSFAVNTTTHIGTLTIGAVSWAGLTTTARKLIVYRARGGASTADELVACIDGMATVNPSARTLTIAASTWEIPLPSPVLA